MIVLGIHGGDQLAHEDGADGFSLHDAAAVLTRDADIVAAIEEERLSRIKHSNSFPFHAIGACLDQGGVRWSDVDAIAVNLSEPFISLMERAAFLQDALRSGPPTAQSRLADLFRRAFGVDVRGKFRFCPHHLAHAWSAFIPSGFEESLILSIDGHGEFASGMVLRGEGRKISKLAEYSVGQSLGNMYTELIGFLGYTRFDEYKVMGLAPYGDPTVYEPLFNGFYKCLPDGNYVLKSAGERLADLQAAGLVGYARRKGQAFTQTHKDFAAALQVMLERIVLHILRHHRRTTGATRLCMAGGVAHNCTLNGKVLDAHLFDQVFVQPAAHDAGGALGAAWWAYYSAHPHGPRKSLSHLYHGTDVGSADEIRAALDRWSEFVELEEVPDIAAHTARLLADGAVVGWMQGRSEFGPRALGNRSILADPRPPGQKQLINQMVKKREAYRPFAPSILEERATEYFELPATQTEMPFMIFVVSVKEGKRRELGAVTHIDGTARVHTVSRAANPMLWELISQFEKITGVPVLLNTSFNNNAEPIVDSVDDGVTCFLTTRIDYLVVGPFLVRRKEASADRSPDWLALAPTLPPFKKLVKRARFDPERPSGWSYGIDSAMSRYFGPVSAEVSEDLFTLVLRADGRKSFRRLVEESRMRLENGSQERIAGEVLDLWSRRMIALRPATAA